MALQSAFRTVVGAGTTRVVSLHAWWLRPEALKKLLPFVLASADPLAFVLADPFDPLDAPGAVDGLHQLLDAAAADGRRVELLRTDVAGLGFVAAGGTHGAIGLSTTTRHHGLPLGRTASRRYEERLGIPKVFVRRLLSWQQGTALGALTPFGGAGVMRCDCIGCDGRDLSRFDRQWPGSVPDDVRADARTHDLYSWLALVAEVLGADESMSAWRTACATAVKAAATIADAHKVRLKVPIL